MPTQINQDTKARLCSLQHTTCTIILSEVLEGFISFGHIYSKYVLRIFFISLVVELQHYIKY